MWRNCGPVRSSSLIVRSLVAVVIMRDGLCVCVLKASEAVDDLADELHFLQDHVNTVEPIAVVPADIQDQVSDNRVRV